jgi:hypothetical protein
VCLVQVDNLKENMPNPPADAAPAPGFNVQPVPTVLPDVYAVFVGPIDNAAVQRLMNGIGVS